MLELQSGACKVLLNNGDNWQAEDADIIAWQRNFPAVDVHQELMAMESWCDANPKRRKTKQGIKRFVNSWLTKAQDQGGSSPMVKSKKNSLRQRPIENCLADVSWCLDRSNINEIKQHFLNTRGFYYDGEVKTAINSNIKTGNNPRGLLRG